MGVRVCTELAESMQEALARLFENVQASLEETGGRLQSGLTSIAECDAQLEALEEQSRKIRHGIAALHRTTATEK